MIGLLIGSIFMAVYGFAADAIMFCYFLERNSSGASKQCPKPMQDFFEKYKSSSEEVTTVERAKEE